MIETGNSDHATEKQRNLCEVEMDKWIGVEEDYRK